MEPEDFLGKVADGMLWVFLICILWIPVAILLLIVLAVTAANEYISGRLNDFLLYAPSIIAGLLFSILVMSVNMIIGFKYWQWVASNKSTHSKRIVLFWLYAIISGFIEIIISCWFVLGVWQIPTLTLSAYVISVVSMIYVMRKAHVGQVPDIFDTKLGRFLVRRNMRARHMVYEHDLRADTDDVTDTMIMPQ
ncbi:MAG: hypothetical protein HXO72_04695 [Scardovia wiggsiae]|uniref:hypothetical protein n=1 Tax=Scardovia wiggsiae TaxID=230143 RepID=UPI001CAB4064|nr:hypothetical protein [Scardovia wiggsiae]